MFHLYRVVLLQKPFYQSYLETQGFPFTDSLPPEERAKFFRLGLIQSIPLSGGAVFSSFTDSDVRAVIVAFIAIIITIYVCWFLREQVPPTRIALAPQEPDRTLQPTADSSNEQTKTELLIACASMRCPKNCECHESRLA